MLPDKVVYAVIVCWVVKSVIGLLLSSIANCLLIILRQFSLFKIRVSCNRFCHLSSYYCIFNWILPLTRCFVKAFRVLFLLLLLEAALPSDKAVFNYLVDIVTLAEMFLVQLNQLELPKCVGSESWLGRPINADKDGICNWAAKTTDNAI